MQTLPEDLNPASSSHTVRSTTTCNTSWDLTSSFGLMGTRHVVNIHTFMRNTHTYKIKIKEKKTGGDSLL